MSFDPGPAEAFDWTPTEKPVTKKRGRPLSNAARRAINRTRRKLDKELAEREDLRRRLEIKRQRRELEQP